MVVIIYYYYLPVKGVEEKMRTKTLVSENMLSIDCNTLLYHKCIDHRLALTDQAKLNGYHDCYFILLVFLFRFQNYLTF